MIHNEAPAIKERLLKLKGVKSVTRGWPRSFERLPCIAIAKAADTPLEYADDREYLTELEYYIRIFTSRAEDADAMSAEVDAAMEEMGYIRTFAYDDDDSDVRMCAMRYRKYV